MHQDKKVTSLFLGDESIEHATKKKKTLRNENAHENLDHIIPHHLELLE